MFYIPNLGVLFISAAYYMAWDYLYGVRWHYSTQIVLLIGYTCMLKTIFTPAGVIKTRVIREENKNYDKNQLNFLDTFSGHGFIKPIHAHYSKNTGRMIMDYDHYCYWLGNDIGLMNYRYFIQFVCWTFIMSLFLFADTFKMLFNCVHNFDRWSCTLIHHHKFIIIGLFFITMLSVTFLFSLIGEILLTLKTGWGLIDRSRGMRNTSDFTSLKLFFGSKFKMIYWLLPIPNHPKLRGRLINLQKKCGEMLENKDIKVAYKY